MTDLEVQNLFSLVHDKGHVLVPGSVTPSIDQLIKNHRTPQTKTLYRGLCKEDVAVLDSMFNEAVMFSTWSGCLSFTELHSYAIHFSHQYHTKAILCVAQHTKYQPLGLDVVSCLRREIRKDDEAEADMLVLAEKEREWIFAQPRILPRSRKIDAAGYVVYSVSLVTL